MFTRSLSATLVSALALTACGVEHESEQRVERVVAEQVAEKEVEQVAEQVEVAPRGSEPSVEGTATSKPRGGPDATVANEVPADFPLALPPNARVTMANRVVQRDGTLAFALTLEIPGADIQAVAQQLQTALESKGLTVERANVTVPDGAMVTLAGKHADRKLEGGAMLTTIHEPPSITVVLSWTDRTNLVNTVANP